MYIVMPVWLAVAAVLLILSPPIGLVAAALTVVQVVRWWTARQHARRQKVILACLAALPESERTEWSNREGRYARSNPLPRNFPPDLMDYDERLRWANRIGEFTGEGD